MPEITRTTSETIDTNRVKDITDKLEQGIKDLFEGERFKEYLKSMSKFHNYSFNNTLLIAMQKPDASLVAGFNSWKNKFGRFVNKGEKGIQILAPAPFKTTKEMEKLDEDTGLPMLDRNGNPIVEEVEITIPYFKVVSVFDVSQTNGKELPELGANELFGEVKNYNEFFEALKTVSPVSVEFEPITDGAKGYYDHESKTIKINEGMSELQNVKTAIHEIVHAKLHDRDLVKADLAEKKDKKTSEIEAESIAYTVCQHYGIDTSDYSFGYIAAWGSGKDTPELKNSLETIRSTASEIINKIDEQILQKVKEHSKEQDGKEKSEQSQNTENSEKSSNIIGNTKYADISEKSYFKLETAVALLLATKLESENISFSGRKGNEFITLTVETADVEKVRAIEKDVKAEIKATTNININTNIQNSQVLSQQPETTNKSNIIGNTKYADIENKKFFNVDSSVADNISAELEKQGIKFSGKISDNNKTTFTLSEVDVNKFREIEKSILPKREPQIKQTINETNASNARNVEKSDIIGSTKYSEISDKKYFKIDTDIAKSVATEFEKQGIKFSGRIAGDKTTLTIGNADIDKYKAIYATVKNRKIEAKVADKMPETTYNVKIYQVNDENKDIRFATLKSLESSGKTVNFSAYDLAYSADFKVQGMTKEQLLEDIFSSFNMQLPPDFKGRSPSVSDVFVAECNGEQTA
jgi:antirestriction protein ArdC